MLNIFDPLVSLRADGQVFPGLAESWTQHAGRARLDVQAEARRQVPRRHAAQRRGRQVQLRPDGRSRDQVPPGRGRPPGLLRPERGGRPDDGADRAQEAEGLLPDRDQPGLLRPRVAQGRQGARGGVRPPAGRHRALQVRRVGAEPAREARPQPGLQLGPVLPPQGAGALRHPHVPADSRRRRPAGRAGVRAGGRDRPAADPPDPAPQGRSAVPGEERAAAGHALGLADEHEARAHDGPQGAPGDDLRARPRGAGAERAPGRLQARLRPAHAGDVRLQPGGGEDVPLRPPQGGGAPGRGGLEEGRRRHARQGRRAPRHRALRLLHDRRGRVRAGRLPEGRDQDEHLPAGGRHRQPGRDRGRQEQPGAAARSPRSIPS